METSVFIDKSKKIFGDKFTYEKTHFKSWRDSICITCKKHGDIWVYPTNHLRNGQGCLRCKCEEHLIEKGALVHNGKYDYSKINYVNTSTKVCIVCPEHGDFWQTSMDHLSGRGCPKCGGNQKKNTSVFVRESSEKYGKLFDYSRTIYRDANTKCTFICTKHNLEFQQTPHNHLRWNGCPLCKVSKMEDEIRELLNENGVVYEEQKTFEWLKYKNNMFLDFFIPSKNIAIECQGEQHFETFRFNEDDLEKLKARMERDQTKKALCEEHGIEIIYFGKNKKYNKCCEQEITFSKESIIKKIKNESS